MALNGTQVLLMVFDATANEGAGEYVSVAEQTGLSMEESVNLIEASSKESDHTKWLYGKSDGTLSLEALYVPNDRGLALLKQAKKERKPILVRRDEAGQPIEQVEALIETISTEFPDNDNATVSVDLQLNGNWQTA